MKTLYFAIIIGTGIAISIMAGMLVTVISAPQHVPADISILNKTSQIEISDITTSPETITVGESFQIYAIIKNNNPYPISFGTGCGSPLSASFDKNVLVNETVLPCPLSSKETLESGQETRIHGPDIGTTYNATLAGEVNADITFSYEMDGKLDNITVSKHLTIYPPRTDPVSSHNLESLQFSNGITGTKTSQVIPQIYDNAHNWTYLTDGKVSSIKISSDGSLIVVGTNTDSNKGSVYLFDNHGLLLWQKTLDRRIGDVAISPDNSFISASGFQLSSGSGQFYENGKMYFFDTKGNQLWDYEAKGYETISSAFFYPNDSVVTTINDTVIDFNKKGDTIWKFSTNDYLRSVSTSQDGSFVAAYSSNKIYFLDSHGNLLWTFVTDDRNIDRVILSHDGRYVVTGDATSGYEGTIYFLDNTGKLLWKNPVGGPLNSISISKDYSIAATNNWQTYLFDSKGMQLWKDNIPSLVTISSDGSLVVGTTYANGTNRITFFDRQGNIASNYPISDYTTTFTLSQDDKYFVIANGQDQNQVSFFELGQNISHQSIVANLTSMQTSNAIHMEVVPKDTSSFDVTVQQGQTVRIPWDIKLDNNYTTFNLQMSIQSPSNMESWIAPIDPYSTINGIPPGDRIITIHPSSNLPSGNYTVRITGQGDTVDQNTGWMTDLDNKTLGIVHVLVKPSKGEISIRTGLALYEMRTFCVNLEPSGQSCGSGPIYEEIPITVYSNSTQTVKMSALGFEEGEWVKFVPDQLVTTSNGVTVKMIIAGYEIPVLRNPLSDKSLVIQAASTNEIQTKIIPVIPLNLISILHLPSPIKLGKITTNSDGVNFVTSGAVYDPLDNSNGTLPVKLSVLGLLNGNNTVSLPLWLSVEIPNPSFTLNATQPYYFMTTVKTSNAPPSGTYNIAIDENIGGQHFVQPEEIIIENVRY